MLIPHQANQRIIDSAMRGLKLDDGQVFVNLDRYGNTSSASVPIEEISPLHRGSLAPAPVPPHG